MTRQQLLKEIHELELWIEACQEEPFWNEELIQELEERLEMHQAQLAAQ